MDPINIGIHLTGRQSQKFLCRLLLLILLALVSCTPTSTIPPALPAPTHTTIPEPTATPVPTTPVDPMSILPLQLDIFPDVFAEPAIWKNYGRVPVFTLYEDGTLIYAPGYYDDEDLRQAMRVQLAIDETNRLMKEVIDLGLLDLKSENCNLSSDHLNCVSDSVYYYIRFHAPEGMRFLQIYAGNLNSPDSLRQIIQLFTDYDHPNAQPYVPTAATLFLERWVEQSGELPWPLSADWLAELPPLFEYDELPAYVLEGQELETFLAAVPRNMGEFYFVHEGEFFRAYLVPWLPDRDYRAEIGR